MLTDISRVNYPLHHHLGGMYMLGSRVLYRGDHERVRRYLEMFLLHAVDDEVRQTSSRRASSLYAALYCVF